MERGLNQSKWAPSTAKVLNPEYSSRGFSKSRPPAETPRPAELQAYGKLLKSYRLLKWRSTSLLHSFARAINGDTANVICNRNFWISSDTGRANAAEIMFKADFFDWFGLLENCLLRLLDCFGIVITAGPMNNNVPSPSAAKQQKDTSLIGDSMAFYGYTHRFHANVLAALDKPSNPLHKILGTGHVRTCLGEFKQFRNRWKDVQQERNVDEDERSLSRYHQIMKDLQLEPCLFIILSAMEDARSLASQHLAAIHGREVDMVDADEEEGEDMMDWD